MPPLTLRRRPAPREGRSTSPARAGVVFGIAGGLLYLVNPFAARLVLPGTSLPDVASNLGSAGQPFAAFFNGADVASGLCSLTACGALLFAARHRRPRRVWMAAVAAMIAQAAGTILAALFPLPPAGGGDPAHWALSRLDGVGLLASCLLFAGYKFRADRRFLAAAVLVALTFALYQVTSDPALDGALQRLCIIETACWIGLFPVLSSTR
jgi:hypothetical protein